MTRPKKLSQREMDLLVENFNLKYPVGTRVKVKKDDGSIVETRTISDAYTMEDHTPVIILEGISGCYMLDRVAAA